MPLYEYRCKECGEEFEKQLRFSEADQLPECPTCKSARTQKRLSRVTWLGPASASGGGASSRANCGSSGPFT
jgi:putative FmdB family regulatory protein